MATTKTPAVPTPDHLTICRALSLALAAQRSKPVRARHVGEKLYGANLIEGQYTALGRGLQSAQEAKLARYESATGWKLTAAGKRLAAGDA